MNTLYIILTIVLSLYIIYGFFKSRRARNKVVHINTDNCIGCQRCLYRCHHKALGIAGDESGVYVVLKNPDKCTACGDCIAVCQFNVFELADRVK